MVTKEKQRKGGRIPEAHNEFKIFAEVSYACVFLPDVHQAFIFCKKIREFSHEHDNDKYNRITLQS